jgi:hypothetical protein
MIPQEEFNEIVEKHLQIAEDGKIFIAEPELAQKFTEYLKESAKPVAKGGDQLFWNSQCTNVILC